MLLQLLWLSAFFLSTKSYTHTQNTTNISKWFCWLPLKYAMSHIFLKSVKAAICFLSTTNVHQIVTTINALLVKKHKHRKCLPGCLICLIWFMLVPPCSETSVLDVFIVFFNGTRKQIAAVLILVVPHIPNYVMLMWDKRQNTFYNTHEARTHI